MIFIIGLVATGLVSHAQQSGNIVSELQKIYHLYDSSAYLAFNTTYSYDTNKDAATGKEKHTKLDGEYTVYGNKCFYRVGNIEYLHNDSFSIAAYNDDKFLVASRLGQVKGSSTILPGRNIVDSFFSSFLSFYDNSIHTIPSDSGALKQISFTKKEEFTDSAVYDYFLINYDSTSYSLQSIEYGFKQPVELEEEDSTYIGEGLIWNVKFRIDFSNYRIGSAGTNIFSEARLINEEYPGKWIATGKYAGYTIYWSDERSPQTVIEQ